VQVEQGHFGYRAMRSTLQALEAGCFFES